MNATKSLLPHCCATLTLWKHKKSCIIRRFAISYNEFFCRGYIHIQVWLNSGQNCGNKIYLSFSIIKAVEYKIIYHIDLHWFLCLKLQLHLTLKRIWAKALSRLPSLLLVYFLHGWYLSWSTVTFFFSNNKT